MIHEVLMNTQTKIFCKKLQVALRNFLELFLAVFFGMYNYQCRCVDF